MISYIFVLLLVSGILLFSLDATSAELKARDQMAWVRAVNGIRNMAEEIVLNELIYR